jgi:hypothetical protein
MSRRWRSNRRDAPDRRTSYGGGDRSAGMSPHLRASKLFERPFCVSGVVPRWGRSIQIFPA